MALRAFSIIAAVEDADGNVIDQVRGTTAFGAVDFLQDIDIWIEVLNVANSRS